MFEDGLSRHNISCICSVFVHCTLVAYSFINSNNHENPCKHIIFIVAVPDYCCKSSVLTILILTQRKGISFCGIPTVFVQKYC